MIIQRRLTLFRERIIECDVSKTIYPKFVCGDSVESGISTKWTLQSSGRYVAIFFGIYLRIVKFFYDSLLLITTWVTHVHIYICLCKLRTEAVTDHIVDPTGCDPADRALRLHR